MSANATHLLPIDDLTRQWRESLPLLAQQIVVLLGAWILLGLAVGYLGRESVGEGTLAAISNMIAGALLLPLLGLPTFFVGARGGEALLGGSLGGCLGVLARCLGASVEGAPLVPVAVVMGALFAVTAWPLARVWLRTALWLVR